MALNAQRKRSPMSAERKAPMLNDRPMYPLAFNWQSGALIRWIGWCAPDMGVN